MKFSKNCSSWKLSSENVEYSLCNPAQKFWQEGQNFFPQSTKILISKFLKKNIFPQKFLLHM